MFKKSVIDKQTLKVANFIVTIVSLVVICITLASVRGYDETMLFEGSKSIYKWGTDASIWVVTAVNIYMSGVAVTIIVMLAYTLELMRTASYVNTNKALAMYGICLFCIIFSEICLLLLTFKYDLILYTVNDIGESVPVMDGYGMVINLHDILRIPRMLAAALGIFSAMMIFLINKHRSKG